MNIERAKEIVRSDVNDLLLLPDKLALINAGRMLAGECDKLDAAYLAAIETIFELASEKKNLMDRLINLNKITTSFDKLIRPEEGV